MYGLLLAVVGEAVALGAIVINRLAITVVEALLLLVGVLLLRRSRESSHGRSEIEPTPVPALRGDEVLRG